MSRAVAWPTRTFKRFSADRSAPMAASIAFYSAFSLAPTLVMVIAVAGLVFGEEAARGQIFHQVSGMLGKDAAASVQTIVEHAHRSGGGGIAAIISFVLLAVGASATFSSLNTALSVVWPAEDKAKSGVATLVKVRLISFGLVMGVAFLLIVSLVLDTAVQAAGKFVFGESPLVVIGDIAQFLVGLVILACAFAALMKYLPDGHVAWRDAFVGGAIAAVLFSVGKKLFALYLTHAGTANAFGAAGSLAVLMMWLYFAAAVLLLGAEAAAARVEAREGQPVKSSSASDAPGAPAMPAPGTGASSHADAPRGGVHDAPHAPVLASAAHAQPVAPAPLPPVPPSTSGTRSSPWANAVSKGVDTVKANPIRLAIAAAGASLFVFTKGSSRTQGRHHRSVKA
nr:YihY/virulence factor BrkB family protein [Burkholderia sp. 8Y]